MKTINTVLFDLDGTLLDTAPDMTLALNQIRERHQLAPLPLDIVRPQVGFGSRALLKLGFEIDDSHQNYPILLNEFFDVYEACMNENTALFSGMETVLETIEKSTLRWGIITNKPERFTMGILRHLNLLTRSSCVISGDTLPKRKPHPDQLHYACDSLNVTPEECLYIGDTITDVKASQAAHMRVIAALYGYISKTDNPYDWNADDYIHEPIEILDYLRKSGVTLR